MTRNLKILTGALWALALLAMAGFGAAVMATRDRVPAGPAPASDATGGLPVMYAAPAFSLTDQTGRTVTDADLRGSVWVAGFIFTRCAGPCPMMTAQMAAMQSRIASPAVRFVLFTVDPEHDTPAVLKAYADQHGADPARWHLLTGEAQALYDAALGMKVTAIPADADNPIIHSQRFLLVDKAGQVRAAYDSATPTDLDRLAKDAEALARS